MVRDHGHPHRPFVLVVEVPGLVPGGDGGRHLGRVAVARVDDLERDLAGGVHHLLGLPVGAEAQPGAQRLVAAHDEAQSGRDVRHGLTGRQRPDAAHRQGVALVLHDRPDLMLAPAELRDAGAVTLELNNDPVCHSIPPTFSRPDNNHTTTI